MINRLKGIMMQELYIASHSREVFFDIFFLPMASLIAFGYMAQYFAQGNGQQAMIIILGYILWEAFRIMQYLISVGVMWNIWSHNLSNLFITPLNFKEYFGAKIIIGAVMVAVFLTGNSLVSYLLFGFNILSIGIINILLIFLLLASFGASLGIVFIGIIFRFSTRVQAMTWGLIYLFQPITAVFYPLEVLPTFVQKIALVLPPTYAFEAARVGLFTGNVPWNLYGIGFALTAFYGALCAIAFQYLLKSSKMSGQFVKNDEM